MSLSPEAAKWGYIRELNRHTGRVSIPAMNRLQFDSLSLDARDIHVSHGILQHRKSVIAFI